MHNYTKKIVLRKDYTKADGTNILYLQCFINKAISRQKLGISVKPEWFNADTGLITIPKQKRLTQLYRGIVMKARSKADNIFAMAILSDKPLNKKKFEQLYSSAHLQYNFLVWMKKEIEIEALNKAEGTVKNYWKTYNLLKEYQQEIDFSSINYDFVRKWNGYMKETPFKTGLGGRFLSKTLRKPNTLIGHHKRLGKFIRLAQKKYDDIDNPYDDFDATYIDTNPVYLTLDELKIILAIYRSNTLDSHLQRVLRQYLFMCFSSLRFSEMSALTHDEVLDNYLIFAAKKTRNTRMIQKVPLNEAARWFLGQGQGREERKIFHVYKDNNTYNSQAYLCRPQKTA